MPLLRSLRRFPGVFYKHSAPDGAPVSYVRVVSPRRMATDNFDASPKALQINLDGKRYGTFAEIGAGQEVARWFFRVGGAAKTVAKTISAYDMAVSDAIYGPTDRYVSRRRLKAMLDYEYDLLLERLFKRAAPPTQAEANGLYLLMELGDNDLLDLFLGRQKPTANLDRPEVHQVLEAVRAQGTRPGPHLSSATFSRTPS